jgi:hypothetical protein
MSADIEQPVVEEAEAAPVVEEEAAAPETPEAERDVETDTLEIPDSSAEGGKARYVPISALAGARAELKTLKGELKAAKDGSARAATLEQQIAQLQQQVSQLTPYAQAYQAAVQQPQAPAAEDDTEAVDLATALDLYTPEGKPDIAKAKRVLATMERKAESKAEAKVAPIHHQNVRQASAYNLQRALNTDVNGQKPDPVILRSLWGRLDPSVTANEEQAKHLVIQALGMSVLQGKTTARAADGKFTAAKEEIPPPLHVEKAGGRDTAPMMAMSDAEKKLAKEIGLSEKEYLERAKQAPWLR